MSFSIESNGETFERSTTHVFENRIKYCAVEYQYLALLESAAEHLQSVMVVLEDIVSFIHKHSGAEHLLDIPIGCTEYNANETLYLLSDKDSKNAVRVLDPKDFTPEAFKKLKLIHSFLSHTNPPK